MSEHPNSALIRTSYEAIAKGDLAQIGERLLADDVVFHVPGTGPLAGEYRGKDEVLGYLTQFVKAADDSLRLEPETFLTGNDHAAALLRIRGQRGDRVLDGRGVQVFRIEDGKIAERWSYPEDPSAVDEFFA